MYILTMSTPERANTFISNRTHKSITKNYAHCGEGLALFYFNGHDYRYIGYFSNNKLIKVAKMTNLEQYKNDSLNARTVPILRADVVECIDLLKLAYFDDSDQVNALIEKLEELTK